MTPKNNTDLKIHHSPGADVQTGNGEGAWNLQIPAGLQGSYRLAQLDDYGSLQRSRFPWYPPLTLQLSARVSSLKIPGTWGFGLWNDPFSISLGLGGGTRRFPALPNAAWFFHASPQNYLSFQDDLPANGFLTQTFRAPKLPTPILMLAVPGLPLLLWPWLARRFRPIFRRVIAEDSFTVNVDVTQWHSYTLEWLRDQVVFKVDDQIFQTKITPQPPLGLVIWIDNQYAAFHPNGKLAYGTLENPESSWLEVKGVLIQK